MTTKKTENTADHAFQKIVESSYMELDAFCEQYHIPYEKGLSWVSQTAHCPSYVQSLLKRFVIEDLAKRNNPDNTTIKNTMDEGVLNYTLEHMSLSEMMDKTKLTVREFCRKYGFPFSTICNWRASADSAKRTCPRYMRYLIFRVIIEDYSPVWVIDEPEADQDNHIEPPTNIAVYRPYVAQDPDMVMLTIDHHDMNLPVFLWNLWKKMHPIHTIELFRNVIGSLHDDFTRVEWKLRRAVMHEYLFHEEFLSINRLAADIFKNSYLKIAISDPQAVTRQVGTLSITFSQEICSEEELFLTALNQLICCCQEMDMDVWFCLPLSVQTFLVVSHERGQEQTLTYVYQNHTVCFQTDAYIFAYEIEEMQRQINAVKKFGVPVTQAIESYISHRIDSCTGSLIIQENAIEEAKIKRKSE